MPHRRGLLYPFEIHRQPIIFSSYPSPLTLPGLENPISFYFYIQEYFSLSISSARELVVLGPSLDESTVPTVHMYCRIKTATENCDLLK